MIKYNANQGSVWMAEGLRSVLTDDSEKTDSSPSLDGDYYFLPKSLYESEDISCSFR